MFVNSFVINPNLLLSGTTATTFNIPITMEYQMVDQAELVQEVFVDKEVEAAINPILDYDKARFLPTNTSGVLMNQVIYNLNLLMSGTTNLGATNYGAIGFADSDIQFETNAFTESFITLSFYDSDNALNQNLVTYITIFSQLSSGDLLPDYATQLAINGGVIIGLPGQPKPANQIPLSFVVSNPILVPKGFSEGYHLYDYKNDLLINGPPEYLYMRATFNNAKTGQSTNMMVKNIAYPIDELINQLYTRYILYRNSTGYYYKIDPTFNGDGKTTPNNVNYSGNTATVNLYQINAL